MVLWETIRLQRKRAAAPRNIGELDLERCSINSIPPLENKELRVVA